MGTSDNASTFTLSAGKASTNAYLYQLITITDAGDSNQETRVITGYTSGRVVTVNRPFSFVPAVSDAAVIWENGYFKPAKNLR